jgi:ABC-2 type transport system ATP-binding protein
LCGIVKSDQGKVLLNGIDLANGNESIKKFIGVVPQDIALYPSLTAKENLAFYGAMYGIDKKTVNERSTIWLEKLGLTKAANKKVESFSGGMKRRVNLIASLLHEPKILFLDEPTVGVDVQSRNVIIDLLKEINQNGTTIIYTSHHLEEAQDLCTQIAIIDYGRILAQGSPQELIDNVEKASNLEDVFLHLTKRKLRD